MRLCVFDLDHTLIRSPLDLRALGVEMRGLLERACGPLPPREDRYRIGELIAHCQREAPAFEPQLWALALEHERRALLEASLEPGALVALAGVRSAGFTSVVWTNNAGEITRAALERFALLPHFELVVTRDEMRQLKPDPDGWRVIRERYATIRDAVFVGDSWVDGLAAAAAGLPFIAYRADPDLLARWNVTPIATLEDLAALPEWLVEYAEAST